jgi:hypothetical protein
VLPGRHLAIDISSVPTFFNDGLKFNFNFCQDRSAVMELVRKELPLRMLQCHRVAEPFVDVESLKAHGASGTAAWPRYR